MPIPSHIFIDMAVSCNIPGDIMIDIISRLPVKSLLRFRCVSKCWNSLISHPAFITMHSKQASKSNSNSTHLIIEQWDESQDECHTFYCHETSVEGRDPEILFDSFSANLNLLGSYNGVLCLTGSDGHTCLWNPSIRKCKVFPDLEIQPLDGYTPELVLGLGFLPQTNDFKMVIMVNYRNDLGTSRDLSKVWLYSLSSNSWKMIGGVSSYIFHNSSSHAFVNGAVHWAAALEMGEDGYTNFILSFDMANEAFWEIQVPNGCNGGAPSTGSTSIFKESLLQYFYWPEGMDVHCWDIWVMKEYGVVESWTKLFTIQSRAEVRYPFDVMKNGEVVVQSEDGKVGLYDPEVEDVEDIGFPSETYSYNVVSYMGSLVLLNEGDDYGADQSL